MTYCQYRAGRTLLGQTTMPLELWHIVMAYAYGLSIWQLEAFEDQYQAELDLARCDC